MDDCLANLQPAIKLDLVISRHLCRVGNPSIECKSCTWHEQSCFQASVAQTGVRPDHRSTITSRRVVRFSFPLHPTCLRLPRLNIKRMISLELSHVSSYSLNDIQSYSSAKRGRAGQRDQPGASWVYTVMIREVLKTLNNNRVTTNVSVLPHPNTHSVAGGHAILTIRQFDWLVHDSVSRSPNMDHMQPRASSIRSAGAPPVQTAKIGSRSLFPPAAATSQSASLRSRKTARFLVARLRSSRPLWRPFRSFMSM
jgi:hypothetical protein